MPVRQGAARLLLRTLCAALVLTGCAGGGSPSDDARARTGTDDSGRHAATPRPAPPPPGIPGLGTATAASLGDANRQALVVTGEGPDSSVSSVVLWERDTADAPWRAVLGPWPAHNALRGWTRDHVADDLRSPIGVFGLGDAGGRLPDPGTLLPYDEDPAFAVSGTGFLGEPLAGSFDYVVAIDWNRVTGTTPLDKERPLGEGRGGGVWIHVDHQGPTRACVSLAAEHMRELLLALDPDSVPVVVMGPAAELGR
ncbi:hypothetical protein [Streptomyces genisteinicus]|uniref:YkuD domain-containing protein n=1 Tax=Streptomyces genisteinicus TaxID=2768068 RepID=A0A7H0HML4_9ACTN|nr:hypothetical protein [Streptomyces genisteinicus]QNP61780.1 hypothetical protein IAG43_01795 [Streptomyces genisteinicus]